MLDLETDDVGLESSDSNGITSTFVLVEGRYDVKNGQKKMYIFFDWEKPDEKNGSVFWDKCRFFFQFVFEDFPNYSSSCLRTRVLEFLEEKSSH